MNIHLSAPIWAIEHVAEAFHLSVDTAREHTYHHDFPAPKVGFARNVWLREEVLAWFASLPTRAADADQRATNTATVATKAAKRLNGQERMGETVLVAAVDLLVEPPPATAD